MSSLPSKFGTTDFLGLIYPPLSTPTQVTPALTFPCQRYLQPPVVFLTYPVPFFHNSAPQVFSPLLNRSLASFLHPLLNPQHNFLHRRLTLRAPGTALI